MGTNYYYRYNICRKCGRYDQLHLGKNSAGWQFHFQAHAIDPITYDALVLLNWEDWSVFMATHKGKIFDEYGKYIQIEHFLVLVSSNAPGKTHSVGEDENYYIDKQGYWFSRGDFC